MKRRKNISLFVGSIIFIAISGFILSRPWLWHQQRDYLRWLWRCVQHLCHLIANHREISINISDLLSFLFVTPELLRRYTSGTKARRLCDAMPIGMVAGAFTYAIIASVIGSLSSAETPWWGSALMIFGGVVIALFAAALWMEFWRIIAGKRELRAPNDTFSNWLLVIGVALFGFTRLAVVIAAMIEK